MRLWEVSKTLYYNLKKKAADRTVRLSKEESNVGADWESSVPAQKQSRYLVYLVIVTFVFFLIAVAVAYYVQTAGVDYSISVRKVEILTQGPSVVDGGVSVPLTIRIANRNPVPIHSAHLIITYPPGAYVERDSGILPATQPAEIELGTIDSGEVMTRRIEPILYGAMDERKSIQYTLKYRAEGSTQPAEVEEVHEVLLRTAPLTLSTPSFSTPVAGKEMTFTVSVRSNAAVRATDAFVELVYPPGFSPLSFSPQPSNPEQTRWRIPALRPNGEFTVRATGVIQGNERHEQAIVARIHAAPELSAGTPPATVVVAEEAASFFIERSFLALGLELSGEETDRITASPGNQVRVQIAWSNVDGAPLEDMSVTAALSGTGLDESSIRPNDGGHFDEITREIVWDAVQVPAFSSVETGADGTLSFRFQVLPNRPEFAGEEKSVRIAVSARARRIATSREESIRNAAVGQVNVRSVLQVSGNTAYSTSVLRNSGPIPPRVGEQTSYVLKYDIKNNGNTLSDFTMTVPLLRGVELADVYGLLRDEWRYDEEMHTVTVTVPAVAGSGPQSGKTIELQVTATPTPRQSGERLSLTREVSYEARDTYVGELFRGTIRPLSSHITAEPADGRGIVVE